MINAPGLAFGRCVVYRHLVFTNCLAQGAKVQRWRCFIRCRLRPRLFARAAWY